MKKLLLSFVAVVIVFFILSKLFSSKPEKRSLTSNQESLANEYDIIQKEEPKLDLWARLSDYDEQLSYHLKADFVGDVHDASAKIQNCYAVAVDVNYAIRMPVDSMKRKASIVKKKLTDYQIKHFPKFRRVFTQTAKDKLWEHDVEVSVSGGGSRIITFSAGIFAANKNVKAAFEQIKDDLVKFRFNKACFAWYAGQDDYQYYTVDSPKDSDLE